MEQIIKRIAIVGMPNVGKSTLFNKLCKRNISLCFNEDNVTVDYISHTIGDKILVDTCGLNGIEDFETLSGKYILESDLILYVVDSRIAPLPKDIEFCRFLYRNKKNLWIIGNKSESDKLSSNSFKVLSGNRMLWTSSEHNLGIEDLQIALELNFQDSEKQKPLIGIVGRANSGKSSLINSLLGFSRVKVEDKIGTTRDSIICSGETIFNKFNFMDTAGYRSQKTTLEYVTKKKRDNSLQYTDGIIIVLDGNIGLTRLDKQILEEAFSFGKFIVICINKMDILTNEPRKNFKYFNIPEWIPVIQTCAIKDNLGRLRETIDLCYGNLSKDISTPEINKLLHSLAPLRSNKHILNIKYMFLKSPSPFVIGYFAKEDMSKESEKYLSRNLAERFKLVGVNISYQRFNKTNEKPKKQ